MLKSLLLRVAAAAALAVSLGAGLILSFVPVAGNGVAPANPNLNPGIYCEARETNGRIDLLPDCTRSWVENGAFFAPRFDAPEHQQLSPFEHGALVALTDEIIIVQLGPVPAQNGGEQYAFLLFVMAPNGIAIAPFPPLDETDIASAARLGVSLQPTAAPGTYIVADGSSQSIRAWLLDTLARDLTPMIKDPGQADALLNQASIILRVAEIGAPEDVASPEEIEAIYAETREVLRAAILAVGDAQ